MNCTNNILLYIAIALIVFILFYLIYYNKSVEGYRSIPGVGTYL
jgi:hypothetical protein